MDGRKLMRIASDLRKAIAEADRAVVEERDWVKAKAILHNAAEVAAIDLKIASETKNRPGGSQDGTKKSDAGSIAPRGSGL